MAIEASAYIEVRRQSPRFQLIRPVIERLAPTGIYHFVGDCDSSKPLEWKATRSELETHFAKHMRSEAYAGARGQYDFQSSVPDRFRV